MSTFLKSIFLFLGFLCLFGCASKKQPHVLKVVATAVPHAEILEFIKPQMKERGIELEILVVDDYQTPNRAVADGEVDANFFQHVPFLEHQIQEFHYPLQVLTSVHLEPMGIYSKKEKDFSSRKANMTFAVPSDPTNLARALLLMEKQGLLKLNRHDTQTSVYNIIDNPKRIQILEIDTPLLIRSLADVDFAVVTTNFALQAGYLPTKDALALEDERSPFVNVVAIQKGAEGENLQVLKELLHSSAVQKFIEQKYQGAVLPVSLSD